MAAANDHREVVEFRAASLLDRGVEGVAVEMGDGEVVNFRVAKYAHRPAGWAGRDIRWRPMAAISAKRVHRGILGHRP